MESQGGGEVRRLHIIYFLSRKGRIEHPHLIRVHHHSRNGIRLRDVKRWLLELRGKDMPESFAWSYKRRYKTGYVWQDLLDEDLITPISDNEYVLQGSEIASTTSNNDHCPYDEEEVPIQKEPPLEVEAKDQKLSSKQPVEQHQETPMVVSKKTSSEIEEESPPFGSETSTLTDDSMKVEEEKHSYSTKQQHDDQSNVFENTSFYSNFLNKKTKKNGKDFKVEKTSPPASSRSSFTRNGSYSSGASQIFRNLISCRAVDTNDSAMVAINHGPRTSLSMPTDKLSGNSAEICKGEKLGGSERMSRTTWIQHQQQQSGRKSLDGMKGSRKNKKSEFSTQKTTSAAYLPVNGPNCSQCGKPFKPEKLHTHMKSCKGMKALAKAATAAAEKTLLGSTDSPGQDSVSAYYLTNK